MPSDDAEPDARPMHAFLRILWRIILTAHAAAAGGWMWMMPGGFPIGHARFWANRGLPALVIAACAAGVWAGWRRRDALLRDFVLGVPMAWASAAVVGRVVFPISARWVWLAPLGIALLMSLLAAATWLGHGLPRLRGILVLAGAAAFGAAAPPTQRADAPSTRPLGGALPPRVEAHDAIHGGGTPAGDGFRVWARSGSVCFGGRGRYVSVSPLLRFWSRSPDLCWTVLAPKPPPFDDAAVCRSGTRDETGLSLWYGFVEPAASLRVSPERGSARIEAITYLREPVYSHLNSFCQVGMTGCRELALIFSPVPDVPIKVTRADYPVGRPARFAYFTEDRLFHVVEASSGEKGPFRVLAAGPLRRGWSLAMTLLDEGKPVCRIVLDDWTAQASTALSPTAGWGVPQNAIEFGLGEGGDAYIFITLAATSVGRGWDSVGHGAGTYRNRMRIEPVPPPQDGGDAKAQMPDARGDGA